jgi:hypothetical protein
MNATSSLVHIALVYWDEVFLRSQASETHNGDTFDREKGKFGLSFFHPSSARAVIIVRWFGTIPRRHRHE